MSDNLPLTPDIPSGSASGRPSEPPVTAPALPSLLVDAAHCIVQASPAAERFMPSAGSVDLFTALHPALHASLRLLLPAVFERGISQVSSPVELGPGRPRVVLSVSPYPAADGRPLALVLLLVDEPDPAASRPEIGDLGPTTLLGAPDAGEPSLLDRVSHSANGDTVEPISQLQTDYGRLKETEARLLTTAEMLDTALEASRMGWITLNAATGMVELDARARTITGLTDWTDAIHAQQWMERVHPDDVPSLLAELEAAEREDRRTHLEYRLQAGDGAPRLLRITGMYRRGPEGAVTHWTGLVSDVTEQRALEESLRRRTRMLQLASEASEIGWGAYDPDSGLTVWDARGYEIMGFSGGPEERTEADFLARVHPDDRDRIAAELARSKTAGGDYRREYRIIRLDGEVRDIVGTGAYLVDESGRVIHGTGFLWDVTERKRQERERDERERSLRLAVSAGKLGLWEWDIRQGTIRAISAAPGLTPAGHAPLDDYLVATVHPDDVDAVREALAAAAAGDAPYRLEMRMRSAEGGYHWARSQGEPVRDTDGKPIRLMGVTVDIHDIKENEQELRRQADMLRLASEAAGIGWATSDVESGLIHWDGRARQILGYPAKPYTWTQKEVFDHIYPEDRERVLRATGANAEELSSFEREYRVVRVDGQVRDIVARGIYLKDEDGIVRGTGLIQDVTEHKQQQRELEERERTLRLAAQAADLSLWEWVPETGAMRFLVQLEGFPPAGPADTLEQRLRFAHPEDRERLRTAMRAAVEENQPLECEFRTRYGEDDYHWFRATGEPITGADSRRRLLGVSIDIQAEKENEWALQQWAETLEQRVKTRTQELEDAYAELQAAHERFHTLFEANPVPTLLTRRADQTVLDANSAFLAYTALTREEVVGRTTAALSAHYQLEPSRDALRATLADGHVSGFEHRFVHVSGQVRTLLLSIEPIEIDDQPCILSSFVDITARKAAEEQVRELASQLSIAEQLERQRVSAILHDDLQQRLYALQLQLHWLLEMAAEGDGEGISAAVNDLLALVPDTISVTRRLSVDLSPPILKGEGLVEALDWLAGQMREQYGLEIDLEAARPTRLMDEGLRILVFQVLRELLFNVVKHAGVLRAAVKVVRDEDSVTVTVHDGGKGFDATAVLEGRGGRGPGHGLAMNRQRLELVGGSMAVNSTPGAGTTIVITVPITVPMSPTPDGNEGGPAAG